jgi:hypothetical protein
LNALDGAGLNLARRHVENLRELAGYRLSKQALSNAHVRDELVHSS